ncbi:RagB/SusD family nutrient uptake outer membrane protein [Algoriphagus chordae]|uniref:Putative outer membrane starch-binding protein n=1 Tax=Algoriphagus chordae TaxID=237019 RepID=A0A2W7QTR6_9BACT|nr:RagB/SusD family nutrient uptake outer membrane protein [Algoriphagus chordae]PZX51381.1 putative outer membrane starch-binding protein [Algoriphagus chordae]
MKSRIILMMLLLTVFASCESQLSKTPDFISEEVVFEDKNLTEAYIASIYQEMLFIDMGGEAQNNMGMIPAAGAEHINYANWQTPNSTYSRSYTAAAGAGPLDYWGYNAIRDINYLIENIGQSKSLSEAYILQKINEARFLRAYTYFQMVIRFGGVPLITKVQNVDDPYDVLYPPRAKEQEIYEFILSELDEIILTMPDLKTGAAGRIDKYTALALSSRASLYAASIGNFGTVQNDGLVGIEPGSTEGLYQKAYDTSKEIIDSGLFLLYDKHENKKVNFSQLFLDEGNDEVIFAEVFEPVVRGHSLDNLSTPAGFLSTWNSNFPVLYDIVELFDFVDGRKGTDISRDELNSSNTWDIDDFFGNRDPRFTSAVFYPESVWQGGLVYFHSSTTYTDDSGERVTVTSGTLDRNGEEWPAAAHPRNVRNTALLLRKKLDETNLEPISGRSGQDFYVFRYAETLLNFAEAAFYLGKTGEALDALNQLRDRAGMPLMTEATEANIRQERQVELAFESHRFWDLIRWRIAPKYLDKVRTKGLVFNYDMDADTYVITLKNAEGTDRSFGPERFYLPISLARIADNPSLEQNPGY